MAALVHPPHVVLSGSMRASSELERVGRALRDLGCAVTLPRPTPADVDVARLDEVERLALKRAFVDEHLAAIRAADLVLVANVRLAGIDGYVGASALMEVAFAHALGRPLALLHAPGPQPARDEVLALDPALLHGRLDLVPELARRGPAARVVGPGPA